MEANPPPLECRLGAAAASDEGKNSIGWKYLIRTGDAKKMQENRYKRCCWHDLPPAATEPFHQASLEMEISSLGTKWIPFCYERLN
jgi:hypothetical protein